MAKGMPKNSEGERKWDCLHYNICLNYAAEKRWNFFDCTECRDYLRDSEIDRMNLHRSYSGEYPVRL